MNVIGLRIAACATFLLCVPLAAQEVRYEQSGQAYVMDLVQSQVEARMLRGVLGMPAADRGQVVFYRPTRPGPGADPVALLENGTTIGMLPADNFIVAAATPGVHRYRLDAGPGELSFEVRPGRTYFVRIGTPRDATRLVRSDAVGMIDAARGRHELLD